MRCFEGRPARGLAVATRGKVTIFSLHGTAFLPPFVGRFGKKTYFCNLPTNFSNQEMKKTTSLFIALFTVLVLAAPQVRAQYKFGYLSYDSLLYAMPEYVEAQKALAELRQKYQAETQRNETLFNNMYADYLQGQKDFPQTIMLKRQKELQDEMTRGIQFRNEVGRLLAGARRELEGPVRALLDSAIVAVGNAKGYEYILNTDGGNYPFIHSGVGEDATHYVAEQLALLRRER